MCGCGKVKVSNFNKKRIQQRKKAMRQKKLAQQQQEPSLEVTVDGGVETDDVVDKKSEKMKKRKMIIQKLKQVHKKMNRLKNKRMNEKSPFSHRFYLRA